MRILVVGDVEDPLLHEHFRPERWEGPNRIDLLLSCGDLSVEYLDFLISMFRVPGYYVAGNHDTSYVQVPPAGWDNLDGRLVVHDGLRLAGFAGCMRYTQRPEPYQFTERQMAHKAWRMRLPIWRAGGLDLVVSHAAPAICPLAYRLCDNPAGGARPCTHTQLPGHLDACPDARDLCHHGFLSLRGVLDRYQPRYWLHGHNHLSYARSTRVHMVDGTSVVNAYGHTIVEIEPRGQPRTGK